MCAAEQAAMAIEVLFIAYRKQVKTPNDKAIQDAIQQLFDAIENPSSTIDSSFLHTCGCSIASA
jgi:hypothetical protein